MKVFTIVNFQTLSLSTLNYNDSKYCSKSNDIKDCGKSKSILSPYISSIHNSSTAIYIKRVHELIFHLKRLCL